MKEAATVEGVLPLPIAGGRGGFPRMSSPIRGGSALPRLRNEFIAL